MDLDPREPPVAIIPLRDRACMGRIQENPILIGDISSCAVADTVRIATVSVWMSGFLLHGFGDAGYASNYVDSIPCVRATPRTRRY